jgi:hypothetical protein
MLQRLPLVGCFLALTAGSACGSDKTDIVVSPGFHATVFADKIGHARHLVVAPNGVVYVNTWSGRYYKNDTPPAGGFLVALQDTQGTGKAATSCRKTGPNSTNPRRARSCRLKRSCK